MTRRTERINELLREEISALVLKDLKDPRMGGLVTITEVDVSPDLRNAKVLVSVLGTTEDANGTMRALHAASHYIQRELRRRLTIRRVPELVFQRDTTIEQGARVLALLDETAKHAE
jgi:ribosome-binding factor A